MPQFDFFIWFALSFYTIFIFQFFYYFMLYFKKSLFPLLFSLYIFSKHPRFKIVTYLDEDPIKPMVDEVINNINSGCPGMNGVSGLIHMIFAGIVMYTTCQLLNYFFPVSPKEELAIISKVSEVTSELPEI